MDKSAAISETVYYLGTFALIYLTCMVGNHGSASFVLDWGCVVTALTGLGLFHVGSQRTPNTIYPVQQAGH